MMGSHLSSCAGSCMVSMWMCVSVNLVQVIMCEVHSKAFVYLSVFVVT